MEKGKVDTGPVLGTENEEDRFYRGGSETFSPLLALWLPCGVGCRGRSEDGGEVGVDPR